MKKMMSLLLVMVMVAATIPGTAFATAALICTCVEHCTAGNFNEYCDVCGVDAADCQGTDAAARSKAACMAYMQENDRLRPVVFISPAPRGRFKRCNKKQFVCGGFWKYS